MHNLFEWIGKYLKILRNFILLIEKGFKVLQTLFTQNNLNKFSDWYIKTLHSFVTTSLDLQEKPLFLPLYSRRYHYEASVKLFVQSDKRKINFLNLFVRLAHLAYTLAELKSTDWGQIRANKFRTFFIRTNFYSYNFFLLTYNISYCFWISDFQDMLNHNLTGITFWWYVGMITNSVSGALIHPRSTILEVVLFRNNGLT